MTNVSDSAFTDGVSVARPKTEYSKLLIGGKWVEPSTSDVIEIHSPATGGTWAGCRWQPRPTPMRRYPGSRSIRRRTVADHTAYTTRRRAPRRDHADG